MSKARRSESISTSIRALAPKQEVAASLAALGRRRLVIAISMLLFVFGLVMVTSATSGTSAVDHSSQWDFFFRQLLYGGIAFTGMMVAMKVPLGFVERMAWPSLVVSGFLLFLVFIPGLSHTANGATRWIQIGGFQMQPSELVKFSLIIYIASYLSHSPPPDHWLRSFIRGPGGIAVFFGAVIFMQRDLGSSMVALSVVMVLFTVAGTRMKVLAQVMIPGILLVIIGIAGEEYRRERFLAFLNPWADPHGPGYQLVQALIAIGSGGPFGVGLGHSVQKIHYLPEAQTDMIYSIVAEELGMVGVLFVVSAFSLIAFMGVRIALRAERKFSALLAIGITSQIVGQAILNIAGVVGVLPLTGVPLPLVSYGGTNLLTTLVSMGLLANIATEHVKTKSRSPDEAKEKGRAAIAA